MSGIQETAFDLLVNTTIQVGLFALLAAAFSRLVARARARHQYLFYLTVLLFCLTVPVINSLYRSPATTAKAGQQQLRSHERRAQLGFWNWQRSSAPYRQFAIAPTLQRSIVWLWGLWIVFRLSRFSRAVYRVHRLRRNASILSLNQFDTARQIIGSKYRVVLLASSAIDDPVAFGVFRPVIVLPSRLLVDVTPQELSAVLAHEYGHILRRDFSIHVVCELLSLPVAWHPGIAYLMSKISQTRELACDDYAAARLGTRRLYAKTLLRLASLCLHVPHRNTAELGFFDGDNLEARLLTLTGKRLSLSRASRIGLVLVISVTFGVSTVLAHAMSVQASSESSKTTKEFVGTWHWMFDGRSFVTMVLVRDRGRLTGTVTGSRIALNEDGELSEADPSEDLKPKPITKAIQVGSGLRITVAEGNEPFEFLVTLKDKVHAEIHPKGAPPNMKPIPAEKVH